MRRIIIFVVISILTVWVPMLHGQEEKKKESEEAKKQFKKETFINYREKFVSDYTKKLSLLKLQKMNLQTEMQQNANSEEAFRQKAMLMQLQEKQIQYEQALAVYAEFGEKTEQDGLEFLQEHAPDYYEEVLAMKSDDPDGYKRQIVFAIQKKWSIQRRAGSDKEYYNLLFDTYGLEVQVKKLIKEYKSIPGNKSNSNIKKELRTNLAQLFDFREKERKREVVKLEEKLSALHENLRLRKKNKDLIVDNRLKQLIGEASTLEW
ncbi:hypothetical protein IIC38_14770 [candidate division KSB1 bacterium]|nr:hypothetical protein [candidate division KSB1 bacterium]